nr:hypothetical protein [Mycolicibacterium baixiangningiae]
MTVLNEPLAGFDPEIAHLIDQERLRQETGLEMIASENYAPLAVMQAQGSVLTNKYAEGYPGRRYYGGCEFVDGVEQLAIDRVKALFGTEYANVQPHSSRRFTLDDFRTVADLIAKALIASGADELAALRGEVHDLATRYPLYPELARP